MNYKRNLYPQVKETFGDQIITQVDDYSQQEESGTTSDAEASEKYNIYNNTGESQTVNKKNRI